VHVLVHPRLDFLLEEALVVAEIELDGKLVLEPSHHVVDGGLGQVLLAKDPVELLDNFLARVPSSLASSILTGISGESSSSSESNELR
jgi:hypothetical protein